jgi:hypothetical protein
VARLRQRHEGDVLVHGDLGDRLAGLATARPAGRAWRATDA